MKNVILASGSPRRKELLSFIVPSFEIIPAKGEEQTKATEPGEIVEHLARHKAEEVFALHKDALVIGADTIVYLNGEILGKPRDKQDAFRMISLLQGNTHQVYTGVTILYTDDEGNTQSRIFHEKTDVLVYEMTEEEIEEYVSSDDPYDKAGGYGIQSGFMPFVQGIRGDYHTVMGMPVARLYHELKTIRNLT